jgi:type IV pilus assembly protein PilF
MKKQVLRLVLPVVAALLFAGCMSAPSERQTDLKEAARLNTDMGAEYLRKGQFRDAKDKLDSAVKQDPKYYKAQWVMALLLEQLDRPAEADSFYKTAMRLQPEDPDIANTYAVYLCKSGKIDEALPVFEVLIRNKLYREPWAAATNAALCLRNDKRNADALAFLERALTMRPDYVDAAIQKADIQLSLGQSAQARQTVDAYLALGKIKERDPHRPDVLMIGVRAALATSDRAGADSYGRLLMRDFPTSPQAKAVPQLLQGAK